MFGSVMRIISLSSLEKAELQLTSAQRKPWLAQLQAEHNNLRAALSWLIRDRADAACALRLAGALPWMWYFGGHFSEGRSWLKQALELNGARGYVESTAKALSGASRLATYAGDTGAGLELAHRSVELWRTTGDRRGLAFALFHEGVASILRCSKDHARLVTERKLGVFSRSRRCMGYSFGDNLLRHYLGLRAGH